MSLQAKINKEIKAIEEKIQYLEDRITRYNAAIKEMRHLLDMAKMVEEGNER